MRTQGEEDGPAAKAGFWTPILADPSPWCFRTFSNLLRDIAEPRIRYQYAEKEKKNSFHDPDLPYRAVCGFFLLVNTVFRVKWAYFTAFIVVSERAPLVK